MVHFDKTWFGGVSIDGKKYKDILVVGSRILEREKLKEDWFIFHSHHTIYIHELEELLKENPEVIIVGNGQSGVLEVPAEIKKKIEDRGIKLIVLETPAAIEEYNKLSKTKRVNALIHTTC